MTAVVCDTSVVLKWFHSEGEEEVAEARALLAAHRGGRLTASILDLTLYELANVLLRALHWASAEVADQLDDVRVVCAALAPTARDLRLAARLAEEHDLTFYDAVYAAAAQSAGAVLASADAALVGAGLAETPAALARRLGLTDPA